MARRYYCVDCNTEVVRRAKRCRPCANAARRKYPVDNKCADCNNPIDKRATRCPPCEYADRHKRGYWRRHSQQASTAWKAGKYAHVDWSQIIKNRWRDGMYDDEECRAKMASSKSKNWKDGIYKGVVFQRRNKRTGIELQMAAALDMIGLTHEPQFCPSDCRYVYDEYISQLHLLLEVDGEYWHSSDKARKRDKEKELWASENGYDFLRAKEAEVINGGAWSFAVNRILPLRIR